MSHTLVRAVKYQQVVRENESCSHREVWIFGRKREM